MNPLPKILALCTLFALLLASDLSAQAEPGTYVFGIEYEGTVCGYAEFTVSNEEKGRWVCQLTSRLYLVFTRNEEGAVTEMIIHEINQMNRKSDPEEIPEGVPENIIPYLGDYLLPQAKAKFTVLWDDGRMAIDSPLEKGIVHFDPPDEEGWRLDEYSQHSIFFEMDDDGKPIALLLNTASACTRK